MGFHYQSKVKLLRLPLVDIAIGPDADGSRRTAIGIFALGQKSIGVFSIGQFSFGLITVSQFGIGILFGLGQFMGGLIVVAQFSIGLVMSLGQFAAGFYSIGMIALGYEGLAMAGWHYVPNNFLSGVLPYFKVFFINYGMYILYAVGGAFGIYILKIIFGFLAHGLSDAWTQVAEKAGLLNMVDGRARIVGINDTYVTINKDPVYLLTLELRTKDGQPHTVRKKTVVPRAVMHRFTPGAVIDVRYDENRPSRINLKF